MQKTDLPSTLGALRASRFADRLGPERDLKEELRSNLICKLSAKRSAVPGHNRV